MEAVGKGLRSSWRAAGPAAAAGLGLGGGLTRTTLEVGSARPRLAWASGPEAPGNRGSLPAWARPGRHCLRTRYVIPHASGFVPAGVRERRPCCCSRPRVWLPCGCSAGSSPGGGCLALRKGTLAFCSYENGELPAWGGGERPYFAFFWGELIPTWVLVGQ